MELSMTLMRHPDHPDEIKKIPIVQWARMRAQGYEFCNELASSLAEQTEASRVEDVEPEKKESTQRKTEPKKK